jgi:DNA-binding transcriptional LysR family regulator
VNWDDLRIIAAVRDEATFAGASLRLRMDETTVARRLARLERSLDLRLFEAADGRRSPTPPCEAVLAHVRAMAIHAGEIERVGAALPGPVGRIRIASTPAVAEEILAPRAAEFLARHPGLMLQFLTSAENVRFSRWEADLAIRLNKPERGDFAITKLGEIKLYFVEPVGDPGADMIICAYPEGLDRIPESQFLKVKGLERRARCVTDNVRVIRALMRSQRAVAVLPEHSCRELLDDHRFRATPLPRGRDAWLLVQNHLKRDAAARLVVGWIRDCFQGRAG